MEPGVTKCVFAAFLKLEGRGSTVFKMYKSYFINQEMEDKKFEDSIVYILNYFAYKGLLIKVML